jgi:hypothetical protein
MSAIAELLQRMLTDVFNERDPQRRVAALAEVFADDVVFSEAEGSVTGRDAVAERVEALLRGTPGVCVPADCSRPRGR